MKNDYIIDTWTAGFEDSNGTATIEKYGEKYVLNVFDDLEKFQTKIDISDILNALAELI